MELDRERIITELKRARAITFYRNLVAEKLPLPPEAEKKQIQIQMNRFIFPVSGEKEIRFARNGVDSSHLFVPGELLHIPACAWSKELWTHTHSMISIVLLRSYLRVIYVEHRAGNDRSMLRGFFYHAAHPLNRAGMEIFSAMQHVKEDSRAINSLFHAFLEVVLEQLENEGAFHDSKERLTWEYVRDYTESNFSADITRESIARAVRLHPAHLSRIFRKYARCGVAEYITALRMEHAKLLLEDPGISIGEIADLCGYSSANYFIRIFRSHSLLSPMKYRERLLMGSAKVLPPAR